MFKTNPAQTGGLMADGQPDDREQAADSQWRHQEDLMDESLDQTFPASDPAPPSHVD